MVREKKGSAVPPVARVGDEAVYAVAGANSDFCLKFVVEE